MTDNDSTTPADAVLDALRTSAEDAEVPAAPDDAAGDTLLAFLPAPAASSAAAGAVDAVTSEPPGSSNAARRARLLETVDRELAARRRDSGPLQAVLRRRRLESGATLDDIAAAIGRRMGRPAPEAVELSRIETGESDLVHESTAVELLADWAVIAELDRPSAVRALHTSLRTSSPEPFLAAAGGSGPAELSPDDQQRITAFETRYDTTATTQEEA